MGCQLRLSCVPFPEFDDAVVPSHKNKIELQTLVKTAEEKYETVEAPDLKVVNKRDGLSVVLYTPTSSPIFAQ